MNAASTTFFFQKLCPNLTNCVADADAEHRLAGIFQNVDDLTRRGFEVNRPAVGQKMVFRSATADGLSEPLAEFTLQKSHDLANTLEREAFSPELANDSDFSEVFHRVKATMSFANRRDDVTLIPPLQLSRCDARQLYDFARCDSLFHRTLNLFQTNLWRFVLNILGPGWRVSSKLAVDNGVTN